MFIVIDVEQILVDPDEQNDFLVTFQLSLEEARECGTVVIRPTALQVL